MLHRWKSTILLPLLLGLLVGCEPARDSGSYLPTSPESTSHTLHDSAPSETRTVSDDSGNLYRVVRDRLPPALSAFQASQLIGLEGGSVQLAGHTLAVPAGAVEVPTLFVLSVLSDGYLEVELLALVADPFQGVLDVGEKGFKQPVSLSLTYSRSPDAGDPRRLRILHLRDDGLAEPVPSTLDEGGNTVTARLEHFSKYCMASF